MDPQQPPQLVGVSEPSTSLGLVPITQSLPASPSIAQLLARNHELESQVKHLEERMETMVSAHQLEQELAFLVQSEQRCLLPKTKISEMGNVMV